MLYIKNNFDQNCLKFGLDIVKNMRQGTIKKNEFIKFKYAISSKLKIYIIDHTIKLFIDLDIIFF